MPAGRPVAYEAGQHFPSDQIVPDCRIHHLGFGFVRRFRIGGIVRIGFGRGGEIHDFHHFEGNFEVFTDRYLRMGIILRIKGADPAGSAAYNAYRLRRTPLPGGLRIGRFQLFGNPAG